MPFATVTTHRTGLLVTLCSCGWEGQPQAVKSEAYADKHRHNRTEHPPTEESA